ncbi:hypothetical protein [Arvimicrobium flavum]|uniref:hypothetical protein n=1 Tax=Arvimicrobium flavum TaxID=3393320 RepID=UPI00237AB2EB|nr:hypothetical protein [Mesorhizobium shangrilense]
MSTSDDRPALFDQWLPAAYAERGDFTVLIVLVAIGGTSIDLLRSTFINVIGEETRWREVRQLLEGAGVKWDAAAFFPIDSFLRGAVPNDVARSKLRDLEVRLREDRRILNDGHFFDRKGRRMKVEEIVH